MSDENKTNKQRIFFAVIVSALAVVAFILGIVFLPDEIVIQIGFNGAPSNVANKYVGLIVPFLLSVVFSVGEAKAKEGHKNGIIALIGLALFAVTFFMNL